MRSFIPLLALLPFLAPAARAATVTELPLLPTPAGYSVAPYVRGLNASGDVLGTIYFSRRPCLHCPTQTIIRSFLVSGGVVTQVGPDGFVAAAINDAGDIVGNQYNPADGLTYAYIIQAGLITPLSTTPGSVLDINNAGQVTNLPALNDYGFFAAMLSDNEHGNHAFKFTGTVPLTDLTCPGPSPDYECMTGYNTGFDFVTDMNNGATIAEAMAVGGDRDNPWSSSYGMQHAFVGYQGQTTYLSAGFTAAALSVNDNGLIAGYDDGAAIVWLPTTPGTWSETSVASLVNDPAWTFREADAVNNANMVAGVGSHNGSPAVFLLDAAVSGVETAGLTPAATLSVSPNPASGPVTFRAPLPPAGVGDAPAVLTIVDVAGRHIATLEVAATSGELARTWDGRSDSGAPVRAGLYFARLDLGGLRRHSRFVLAR